MEAWPNPGVNHYNLHERDNYCLFWDSKRKLTNNLKCQSLLARRQKSMDSREGTCLNGRLMTGEEKYEISKETDQSFTVHTQTHTNVAFKYSEENT